MIFHVTLEEAEDGWIVVECPALPGCVSQGKDQKKLLKTLKKQLQHGFGLKSKGCCSIAAK